VAGKNLEQSAIRSDVCVCKCLKLNLRLVCYPSFSIADSKLTAVPWKFFNLLYCSCHGSEPRIYCILQTIGFFLFSDFHCCVQIFQCVMMQSLEYCMTWLHVLFFGVNFFDFLNIINFYYYVMMTFSGCVPGYVVTRTVLI